MTKQTANISQEEINELKTMNTEDRNYIFSKHLYFLRERFVGEVDFSAVDNILENVEIDLNMNTHRGSNLLYLAIDSFAPAVLKYLLDKGVSTDAPLVDGLTPLASAEQVLENIKNRGYKSESPMVKLAEQSIEILKAHEANKQPV